MELSFIEKCVSNNLLVKNGRRIPYIYNGSIHHYRIDFELPNEKMLIEIKDMHIWHKNQVSSGKWLAKRKAAEEYCKQVGFEYKILFPTDFDSFFETIRRDSLNCNESCRA